MQTQIPQAWETIREVVPPAIEVGTLTLYQLYDLGYAIDLDVAQMRLDEPTAQRRTQAPARQAESIQIAQQPLRVDRDAISIELDGQRLTGQLRASIYDLGTVVLTLTLPLPPATGWNTIAALLNDWQQPSTTLQDQFRTALDDLEHVLLPAIDRPNRSNIVEDYSIIVVEQLSGDVDPTMLADYPQVREALLGECRALSSTLSIETDYAA